MLSWRGVMSFCAGYETLFPMIFSDFVGFGKEALGPIYKAGLIFPAILRG